MVKKSSRARLSARPVNALRALPALAALWFAALFGLGSLAAGDEALGALVIRLNLAGWIAPAGMVMRPLLALGLAGLGALVGLVLGRMVYRPALDVVVVRPRTPAARNSSRPAAQPSAQPESEPAAQLVRRVRGRDAHPDAPPRRPLVVTEDVLPWPTAMGVPMVAQSADASAIAVPAYESRALDAADGELLAAAEPAFALPPFLAAALSAAQAKADAAELADEQLASARLVEEVAPAQPAAPPLPRVLADPLTEPAGPHLPLAQAPLSSLGQVQLIERLAMAIAARQSMPLRAVARAEPLAPPAHSAVPVIAPADPLLRAKPARPGVADDQLLPVATFAAAAEVGTPDEAHDERVDNDRYSSLATITMSRPDLAPLLSAPVAVPAPVAPDPVASSPVVPFRLPSTRKATSTVAPDNGQATVQRGMARYHATDSDRALSEALATLRQMNAQR